MNIKPIHNNNDYEQALSRLEIVWGAKLGTPEGDELDILATLIDKYESEHFPIATPDPVEALLYVIEEKGVEKKEIARLLGGKSKLSEVLSRKRELSKKMIKALHDQLGIPYEILMA